jgi:hypothetical protein
MFDYSIKGIKEHYKQTKPGGHWFDKDTMRFWESVIYPNVYITPCDGSLVYFVTSEAQYDPSLPHKFSVRSYDIKNAEIDTVSKHDTLELAYACAKFIAGATVPAND